MATQSHIMTKVLAFFSEDQVSIDTAYEIANLSPDRVIQVRDVKNRAPKEQAKRYAEQMKHTRFPEIVITHDGWVADGNTRLAAKVINKETIIEAIVLNVDYETASPATRAKVEALAASLNALNGNPLTVSENKRAIRRYLAFGFTAEKIGKELGVTSSIVSSVAAQVRAEERLLAAGVTETPEQDYSGPLRKELGTKNAMALNLGPYAALARLSKDAGLTVKEVGDLLQQAKDAGSDAAAMQVLEDARKQQRERINTLSLTGIRHPSAAAQFRKTLGMVRKHAENVAALVEADPAHRAAYVEQIDEAITVLSKLRKMQDA